MPLARQLSAPGNINLLGTVTLTYGIGQILGPLSPPVCQAMARRPIINATLLRCRGALLPR